MWHNLDCKSLVTFKATTSKLFTTVDVLITEIIFLLIWSTVLLQASLAYWFANLAFDLLTIPNIVMGLNRTLGNVWGLLKKRKKVD